MTQYSKSWCVYIIKASDNSLYTGITTDIERRWRQHSGEIKGGARFFNGRKPRTLAFIEFHPDRSAASIREAEIKKLSRKQKESLLESESNQVNCGEVPCVTQA